MNDDYPTNTELQSILDFEGSPLDFIDHINSMWWHTGFIVKNGREYSGPNKMKCSVFSRCYLSTWGWSGNEDIIGVLRQTWFWMLWWKQSNRGGHYEFEIPKGKFNSKFQFKFGLPHSKVEE